MVTRPEAAGERIVAFARPGKPRESGFFRQNEATPATPAPSTFTRSQRFLKLPWDRQCPERFPPKARNGGSKEASSAQIGAAARMDHPRWRLCGAPVRCARFVLDGGEDHGGGRRRAGGQVAARILARRKNGTEMRSGLAPRQIVRRQIRQVAAGSSRTTRQVLRASTSFRGASETSEPGISRFRVWSFGPSRNDDRSFTTSAAR